jgi:hypothetical protein
MSRQRGNLLVFAAVGCFLRFLGGQARTKTKQKGEVRETPWLGAKKIDAARRGGVEDQGVG